MVAIVIYTSSNLEFKCSLLHKYPKSTSYLLFFWCSRSGTSIRLTSIYKFYRSHFIFTLLSRTNTFCETSFTHRFSYQCFHILHSIRTTVWNYHGVSQVTLNAVRRITPSSLTSKVTSQFIRWDPIFSSMATHKQLVASHLSSIWEYAGTETRSSSGNLAKGRAI